VIFNLQKPFFFLLIDRYRLIRNRNRAIFFFEIIQKCIIKNYLEEIGSKIQEVQEDLHKDILEREDAICRYWNSATCLETAFQEWSDEEVIRAFENSTYLQIFLSC
jgi:hypothetical protein